MVEESVESKFSSAQEQPSFAFCRFYFSMKETFRKKLSANTLQLVTNQLFNLLVFYLLSQQLSKTAFGELNWALAVFLFSFSIASFGFDQLVVQKTAAGEPQQKLLSLHLTHVLLSGCIFYAALFLAALLFRPFFSAHPLLLLIGLGKLLLFFATPFKAIAAGGERFRLVLRLSVSSAVLKGCCLLLLAFTHTFSLYAVVVVFVVSDASELLLAILLFVKEGALRFPFLFQAKMYVHFFRDALPQVGIVFLAAALARVDWILIGLFLSPQKLAEYSFAYKAFEFASLPLLVIAPLLLPYLTRISRSGLPLHQYAQMRLLLKAEIIIACLVALCLNGLWNPVVDTVTSSRYGASNRQTIFIFSLTLPVLYINNFLWSLHFANGRLKTILYSFVLSLAINLLGNFLLLSRYGNEGAATAYFLSVTAQTVFYAIYTKELFYFNWRSIGVCVFCAVFSGVCTAFLISNTALLLLASTGLYVLCLVGTTQLRKNEMALLWQTIT
jgi:O-antigen/teichoic acid export membrane protein